MTAPAPQLPAEPLTTNELWFDAGVRHQIGLLRFAGRLRNQSLQLLDRSETDLREAILAVLATRTRVRTAAGFRARLERLYDEIRDIRFDAWLSVGTLWREELTALAIREPRFLAGILETISPVELDLQMPKAAELRQIVTRSRMNGDTLREAVNRAAVADVSRIRAVVELRRSEAPVVVARAVVGTQALHGRDGITERARHNIASLTRTAVTHVSTQAQNRFVAANDDIFLTEVFTAILDGQTTPRCRAEDGKVYNLGEGPHPPLHYACRSRRNPVLDGEVLGERAAMPKTNRRLLKEFADQEGIPVPKSRAALPRGYKARFDDFKGRRMREIIGIEPRKVTYDNWLRRQSAEFQRDVLGKTRHKLFRRGGLHLEKFVDATGKEFTLSDLARMHADAFRAAGLDPRAFLKAA